MTRVLVEDIHSTPRHPMTEVATLERHELSAIYGDIPEKDFADMRASIAKIGVQMPITLLDGKVLDGWHRYRCSLELEVACPKEQLGSSVDPRDFVHAVNDSRRHETEAARAIRTVKVFSWRQVGKVAQLPSTPGNSVPGSNNNEARTTAQMAETASVSTATIERAKAVVSGGSEQLQGAVEKGDVGLKRAAEVVRAEVPKRDQLAAAKEAPVKPASTGRAAELDKILAMKDAIIAEKDMQIESLSVVNNEMMESLATAESTLEKLQAVVDANEPLKAALEEAKKYREYGMAMDDRVNSLQGDKNDLIRLVKSLEKRLGG